MSFALIHFKQSDQIGRLIAQWTIFYFGQIYENYRSRPKFGATFLLSWDYALIMHQFRQKWVGLHFGSFFTNSSGHPDFKQYVCTWKMKIFVGSKRVDFMQRKYTMLNEYKKRAKYSTYVHKDLPRNYSGLTEGVDIF
jgi:hypothetical protein